MSGNAPPPFSPPPPSPMGSQPPPAVSLGFDFSRSSFLLFGVIGATVTVLVGVCMMLTLVWRRYQRTREEAQLSIVLRRQEEQLAAALASANASESLAAQIANNRRLFAAYGINQQTMHVLWGAGAPTHPRQIALLQQQLLRHQQEQQALQERALASGMRLPPKEVHLIVEPDGSIGLATCIDGPQPQAVTRAKSSRTVSTRLPAATTATSATGDAAQQGAAGPVASRVSSSSCLAARNESVAGQVVDVEAPAESDMRGGSAVDPDDGAGAGEGAQAAGVVLAFDVQQPPLLASTPRR